MFLKSTSEGSQFSGCDNGGVKGWKGSVEVHVERNEDGTYSVVSTSVGNYGKLRGTSTIGQLTAADLLAASEQLRALAQGALTSTKAPQEVFDAMHARVKAAKDAANAASETTVEAPAEAQAEAAASEETSEIEQLVA